MICANNNYEVPNTHTEIQTCAIELFCELHANFTLDLKWRCDSCCIFRQTFASFWAKVLYVCHVGYMFLSKWAYTWFIEHVVHWFCASFVMECFALIVFITDLLFICFFFCFLFYFLLWSSSLLLSSWLKIWIKIQIPQLRGDDRVVASNSHSSKSAATNLIHLTRKLLSNKYSYITIHVLNCLLKCNDEKSLGW